MKAVGTVNAQCPECGKPIECTVRATLPATAAGQKPGRQLDVSVIDAVERIHEHVRAGECGRSPGGPRVRFWETGADGLVEVKPDE
ncbi:hypothetical protein I5G67_gp004 [Mycobacterium phage Aminay]|uniref:Uncharacterized protein n=1 Tax=Mycobacterium phage Aminay TaxID=2250291 RepID=A0A345KUZ0_9CAUD|nr:hypothetical protein I5G67_gp004 [Mycobacterium phage Aminay]AXH46842.1 hypothetical protein SEA_AMINAY_4 [Mycobacterium phage Aminay]